MKALLTALLLALALPAQASAPYGSRYGVTECAYVGGTLTSPLLIPDGTAGAPSLGLVSDSDGTGTGVFRVSANDWGISTNGVLRFDIGTTLVTSTLPVASPRPLATKTATYTVAAADFGGFILDATDNAVITLPAITSAFAGARITIINSGAAGAAKVSIDPAAADAIVGTVVAITSGGVVNKDWISTKVTSVKGDYTTLVADGTHTWFIVGGVGVWASEP